LFPLGFSVLPILHHITGHPEFSGQAFKFKALGSTGCDMLQRVRAIESDRGNYSMVRGSATFWLYRVRAQQARFLSHTRQKKKTVSFKPALMLMSTL
jgi:hypothetical protein